MLKNEIKTKNQLKKKEKKPESTRFPTKPII
jgi:hypothetical protein